MSFVIPVNEVILRICGLFPDLISVMIYMITLNLTFVYLFDLKFVNCFISI